MGQQQVAPGSAVAEPPTPRRPLDLIAGEALEPSESIGIAFDPSTGLPLGEMPTSSESDVDRALAAAYEAWGNGDGSFSRSSVQSRLDALERFADALDARADAFAYWHAREIGIPVATTRLFASGVGDVVRGVAEAAPAALSTRALPADNRRVELHLLPWGPAALYTAWNAPSFLAASKLAYALAAGCPALLKPSEYSGATTGLLVDALVDAELDPGAVQVLCGGAEVGGLLARDSRVRVINYTGGTAGGQAVASAAIGRMTLLQLELSGSNPAIVTPGAPLDLAASELARGTLVLNGQWCEAPRRVYVHSSDHDDLVSRLIKAMAASEVGDAMSETTDVGPLSREGQLALFEEAVDRLGSFGTVERSHNELPSAGYFASPTVIGALPPKAVDREIFGPMLAVSAYERLDDAVRAANGLGDGLAGYVFGTDREEAFALGERLHAGEVRIGGTRVLDLADGSAQSFWGVSGLGGHGRADLLRAHVGTRVIGEEDFSLPL
jgi:betaine-aldehyde dehydrogenase